MVRKHSKLIGKTILDDDESPDDLEMDSGFWHDIIDLYFVRSRESRGREDDDLIFFVRKLVSSLLYELQSSVNPMDKWWNLM